MTEKRKQRESCRIWWLLLGLLVVIALCLLYSVGGILVTDYLPPCYFHKITGFSCPGCGCTRAVGALIKGNLWESLCYNPIILYAIVCYFLYYVSGIIVYIDNRRKEKNVPLRKRKGTLINIVSRLCSPKARNQYLYISIYVLLGSGLIRLIFEVWSRLKN